MAQPQEGIGPSTPVGVAAVTVLSAKMQPLFELEEAAISGTDMDAVHDMRVASRRSREAIAIFEPLYRESDIDKPLDSVKAVTKALGPVRDADVFTDHLAGLAKDAENTDQRVALAYLIGWRQAERSRDLERLRRRLTRLDLAGRRIALTRALYAFKKSADIVAPFGWLAEDVLADRLAAFYSHLPAALDESAIAEQHAMRIAGKHLRYAIETFKSCFDAKQYDALRDGVIAFQDALGEMRDRDVFLDAIGRMVSGEDAARAGVTEEGIAEVTARLRTERAGLFEQFIEHAAEYPAGRMRTTVASALLPAPERPQPEAPAETPAEAQAEPPAEPSSDAAGELIAAVEGGPGLPSSGTDPGRPRRPRARERERFTAIARVAHTLFTRRAAELPPAVVEITGPHARDAVASAADDPQAIACPPEPAAAAVSSDAEPAEPSA